MPRGVRFENKSTTKDPNARADILARGLYMPQQDAYSDIAVIDTAASCYVRSNKDPQAVLRGHQKKKIGKYGERVQLVGTFAPLVHSVFGTLAPEAEAVLAHLVHRLDASVSQKDRTCSMQRVYLQTAVLKATSLCLRTRNSAPRFARTEASAALQDCTVEDADSAPPMA